MKCVYVLIKICLPKQNKGIDCVNLLSVCSDMTSVLPVRATDTVLPLYHQILQTQMNKKRQQS